MEIKNLKKAAQRIQKAIKEKEKIILFSDADLDGTTSLIILEETIKNLGGKISALYFSDRGKEGCGLNEDALKFLKKYSPALLILLDSGIGNFKEVEKAKELGFRVIIIDHHEILEKLPAAEIIVDPKQKGEKYPFRSLAACGLSFKLAKLLLLSRISKNIEGSFLELVALGTIADKMPQIKDNKVFIEAGISHLSFSFRPGLKAFFKFFEKEAYSFSEIVQKIVSALQITDNRNHLTESYLLLSESEEKRAEKILQSLLKKSSQRQKTIKEVTSQIEEEIVLSASPIIFRGGEDIPLSLTGALAGRICSKFKKPTFIFTIKKKLIRGSVRNPEGVNSVEALKHCSSLLETYGGHRQASGFTIKKENLEKFETCLINYFNSKFKNQNAK